MRLLVRFASVAGFLFAGAAGSEELSVTYNAGSAYDSNYFSDTNNLSATSFRAGLGVSGKVEREGTGLGYVLRHEEIRVPKFRFADEHNTTAGFSLSSKVSEQLELMAELRGTRSDAGDVFIALPGEVIGYRSLDHKLDLSSAASLAGFGGKNTIKASYTSLMRGQAHFRPEYFQSGRIKANEALFTLKADHARALAGGEAGATLSYEKAFIPGSQQEMYERFPASGIRGSIAFGRKFADRVAILAEVGLTRLNGDEISDEVQRTRPYLRAEAEWQLNDILALGAGYSQGYALYDLDDPVAEFQRRLKMVMKARLGEKVDLTLSAQRSHNDWIYYDYSTTKRILTAALAFDAGNERKVEVEFSRLLHDEPDDGASYDGSSISARYSGTF